MRKSHESFPGNVLKFRKQARAGTAARKSLKSCVLSSFEYPQRGAQTRISSKLQITYIAYISPSRNCRPRAINKTLSESFPFPERGDLSLSLFLGDRARARTDKGQEERVGQPSWNNSKGHVLNPLSFKFSRTSQAAAAALESLGSSARVRLAK